MNESSSGLAQYKLRLRIDNQSKSEFYEGESFKNKLESEMYMLKLSVAFYLDISSEILATTSSEI
jgi:hypothetical protein